MKEQREIKANFTYYAFGVMLVLALSFIATIPAAMAYNVRTFTGAGLPQWLSEAVSIVILLAPGIAVLVTGLTRIFAVTDKIHAEELKKAAILEGVACIFEIVAALIISTDPLAIGARMTALAAATLFVFYALVMALSSNGTYRLIVLEHERKLKFNERFNELLEQEMETDDAKREMSAAAKSMIRDATEKQVGRQLYPRPATIPSANGHKQEEPHAESKN